MMDLIFNIWTYAMGSLDPAAILSLSTIILSFCVYIAISRKEYERVHYPPFAPGGMFHHVKMVTSAQYPWWLLVGADIFKVGTKRKPHSPSLFLLFRNRM